MTKVLIAVDETEESIEAATLAHRLFGDDAEYLAINVFERPPPSPREDPGWMTPSGAAPMTWGAVWPHGPVARPTEHRVDLREAAAREASDAAERSGLGLAEAIGEVGDPATAVLDAAHGHHVDVIVVGSHERGWLSRLFARSVATDVVKHADVPVLIAK